MKNLILLLIPALCITMAPGTMKAQPVATPEVPVAMGSFDSYLASLKPVPHNTMASFRNIDIRAVRDFKTTYKTVDNEKWYKTPTGYCARFISDGTEHWVIYNKKGRWLHTNLQYDETKLSPDVRAQVKAVYSDYTIFLVEEIEEPRKSVVYTVHMENKTSFRNIRICDREMEIVMDVDKL